MELFASQNTFYKKASQRLAIVRIEGRVALINSGMLLAKMFLLRTQINFDPDTTNLDKASELLQQLKKTIG